MADEQQKIPARKPPVMPAPGLLVGRAAIMGQVASVNSSAAAGRELYTLTMKDGTKFVGSSQPGAETDLARRQAQSDAFNKVRNDEAYLRKSGLLPASITPTEGSET